MTDLLHISSLCAKTKQKSILKDIDLKLQENEIVVLLGPNGTGKSTLAEIIAGSSELGWRGKIEFNGENITNLAIDERAKKGIFLSYQTPVEIPGLPLNEMLRTALEERGVKMRFMDFQRKMADILDELNLDPFAANRGINEGFSGGEKKKLEVAQLLILEPKLAILDEIDSGLDMDAAKELSQILAKMQKKHQTSFLIITHNLRILQSLQIDRVCILKDGEITKTGDEKLLKEVEKNGFKNA